MDLLGKGDVYVETTQKWLARISSVMIWIGFFTLMTTRFSPLVLAVIFIILILLVVSMVWFDIKYVIPSKQKFLGEMNPYLNKMKKDIIDEIKKSK